MGWQVKLLVVLAAALVATLTAACGSAGEVERAPLADQTATAAAATVAAALRNGLVTVEPMTLAVPTLLPVTPEPVMSPTPAQATPTPTTPATPTATPTEDVIRAVVSAGPLNLRAGPATEYEALETLTEGVALIVFGRTAESTWLSVGTASSKEGWVAVGYVETSHPVALIPVVPTPPPLPTAVSCRISVASQLKGSWRQSELGCPTNNAGITWSAFQPFERGFMLWRRDSDDAYIFYGEGAWTYVPERWSEGSPVPDRGGAPGGLQAPVRGFGYVWGAYDDVFTGLGWATDKERGFCALVQDFDRGFLLRSDSNGPCENGLYNHAVEPGFGLRTLKARSNGSWQP